MAIKYISFDLDNTLVSKRFDDLVWFREIPFLYSRKHGLFFEDALKQVTDEYDKHKDKPYWTDVEWWFKHFKLEEDWNEIVNEIAHEIKLFPDTIECVRKLSKKYRLVIVSASNRKFLERKVKLEKLDKYFYKIISTTSELNCVDKNPKTYAKVLKLLRIKSDEIIHIGDSILSDYQNSEAVGIKSYLLLRESIRHHKRDTKANEVLRMIKKANIPKDKIVKNLNEFALKILGG